MDVLKIKEELDALYSKLNPPYGIVPEWHAPAATDNEIMAAETRFGVTLPVELKETFKVFSGISHESPYFMGDEFSKIKGMVKKAAGDKYAAHLEDSLVVTLISPLDEWEVPDMAKFGPHQEYCNMLARVQGLGRGKCQAVFYECGQDVLHDSHFVYIGSSDWETIFIDLNPAGKHFGALYNAYPSDEQDFLLIYKIADNYLDFLERLKKSLETRLKS